MIYQKYLLVAGFILSVSAIFAVGGVDAEDSVVKAEQPTVEVTKSESSKYAYYHELYRARDNAKTIEEKNEILLKIVTGPIVEREDEGGLLQTKYEAVFELMSNPHARGEVQAVIDQIDREITSAAKKDMLDALSISPYKDITAHAYKKVMETDKDLFIKGFALESLIVIGYEADGFEYLKKLMGIMDEKKEIAPNFKVFDSFKSDEIKEKTKRYFLGLRDDQNKSEMIRCYAALICNQKYKADLDPYYTMIERFVLGNEVKESEVKIVLGKLDYLSRKNDQRAKKIIEKVNELGNSEVKGLLKKWKK